MDSMLADEVLKRTQLDLQKHFPKNHVCPKCLAALLCGIPIERLSILPGLDDVGKTLVDWQRGIVHCGLIQHLENLLNHSFNLFHSVIPESSL